MAAWAPGMSVRSCGVLTWPRSSSGWPAHCTFRIGSTGSIRVLGSGGTARLVGLKHGKSVTSRAFIPLSVRAFEPRCPFAASRTSPSAHRHRMLDTKMAVDLHGQRARRLCAQANAQGSEFDLLGHLLAVLVAKVPVGFHGQRPAVFVAEPARDRWNVHAGFDAPGREQVAQVVVREAWNSNLFARPRKCFIALRPLGECGSLPNVPSCPSAASKAPPCQE